MFAKQQTWFMFESHVLETEQRSYQIGCGMTLPEALWWDTVYPAHLSWRNSASLQARCGGRWGPSPSATLGLGPGPAWATLRSALGERALPGKTKEKMFPVGLCHAPRSCCRSEVGSMPWSTSLSSSPHPHTWSWDQNNTCNWLCGREACVQRPRDPPWLAGIL